MYSAYFWLVLGAVLIVTEIFVPGVFILWIGIAALATAGVALLFPTLGAWILLFFAVVTVLSAFVGTKAYMLITSSPTTLNNLAQQLVGKRGICIARLDDPEIRIRIDAVEWAALADGEIDCGDHVVVLRFHDAKPVVRTA
jgi:membrane protein implicated in regulation of membrane protease activity